MSRYTAAYSDFSSRCLEIEILLRRAKSLERSDPVQSGPEISALSRGAIVLLCSHLEGYVKDLGEITVDRIHARAVGRDKLSERFFFSISKRFFDELKDTSDPTKIAVKMFRFLETDAPLWEKTGPLPRPVSFDLFAAGFASPSVDNVSAFLGRFGAAKFKQDLVDALKGDYWMVSNMVENVVSTRNNIAHGDLATTRTPGDVGEMLTITRLFVRTTDDIFARWCKANLCAIR